MPLFFLALNRRRGAPGRALVTAAVAALIGVTVALPSPAAAVVHGGSVGSCAICHLMHDAAAGQIALDGSRPLLVAESSTDLCLTCHGRSNGVFGASPLLPPTEFGAGNFTWLLEDNLNDGMGGVIAGEAAGHCINSPDRGTTADSRWDRAPGGTFPSSSLGCTSCHDPHGGGGYRMLHGPGPVQGGLAVFVYPAPAADGLDITDPAVAESPTRHTAYREGMSLWCENCHGLYHSESSGSAFQHPVDDVIGSDVRDRYNGYDGDANPSGGMPSTAYIPQVPFEGPATSTTGTDGPAATDRIMCLTCHRAHASSAPASGRWDFRVVRLVEDGVASGSYALPSPYPGNGQGQLCRKCHEVSHDDGRACVSCHGVPAGTPFPMIR